MWIGLSDSFFAYPLILLLHTIGLTLIVGVNLVVALRVLGASPEMPLDELEQLFPLMSAGLVMNASTGVLLFIAKASQFIVNPAFYLKMIHARPRCGQPTGNCAVGPGDLCEKGFW